MSSNGALTPGERYAQTRLTPYLGHMTRLDVPGTSGRCDFEVDEGTHLGAVIEATEWVDVARAEQHGVLRRGRELVITSGLTWSVWLMPQARVRELQQSPRLLQLLAEMERQSILVLPAHTAPPGWNALLEELGIEHIAGFPPASGREGHVSLSSGTSGGSGWTGRRVDEWLAVALDADQLAGKRAKLARSQAAERHLYVGLDLDTRAGLGIELMLDSATWPGADPLQLPTVALPTDITDLWLWPNAPSDGLHLSAGGWEVVHEVDQARSALWSPNVTSPEAL